MVGLLCGRVGSSVRSSVPGMPVGCIVLWDDLFVILRAYVTRRRDFVYFRRGVFFDRVFFAVVRLYIPHSSRSRPHTAWFRRFRRTRCTALNSSFAKIEVSKLRLNMALIVEVR